AAWWGPITATVPPVAASRGRAVLAGRVYTGAILHTGPTLKLRDAWSAANRSGPRGAEPPAHRTGARMRKPRARTARMTTKADPAMSPRTTAEVFIAGTCIGVAVGLLARDVFLGVFAGSLFISGETLIVKAWRGHGQGTSG